MRRNILTVLLFLMLILLPGLGMVLKLDRFTGLKENRAFASFPSVGLKLDLLQKFPMVYTEWFNDHFGFRSFFVRCNFLVRYYLLGVSPSAKVVLGKDGWLYYNGEGTVDDFRHITRFEEEKLAAWAAALEKRRLWLERHGIKYVYMIAPNKSTVYGEYLPDVYTKIRAESGLDDMVSYLKQHTGVEVVDCRPALLKAKKGQQVYFRTDTHWNQLGAFLAYQEVVKPVSKWFPNVRPKNIEDYRLESKRAPGGDLAGLIGGTDLMFDDYPALLPKVGDRIQIVGINEQSKSPVTVAGSDKTLPRAIFFRDSFFSLVAPFVAGHFSYSRYYWDYWNSTTQMEEIIRTQRPDIVIEEVVERAAKYYMADLVTKTPDYLLHAPNFNR